MTVRMPGTMRMGVTWVVAFVQVMMHLGRFNSSFFQFLLKTLLDPRVFLIRLDLLHIERYTQALGEVTFRHREIPSGRVPCIEVLVPPVIRRRNDRTIFPIQLHRLRFVQTVLPRKRKSLSIQCQNNGFVRMPVAQLVRTYFEFRGVRFEDGLPRHFPENAAISSASLIPF